MFFCLFRKYQIFSVRALILLIYIKNKIYFKAYLNKFYIQKKIKESVHKHLILDLLMHRKKRNNVLQYFTINEKKKN